MSEYGWMLIMSLWLGLLTSVAPCPMTTNIAAMSFLARRVDKPLKSLLMGAFYSLGRAAAYIAIAVIVVGSLLAESSVSRFLQVYGGRLLGPVLIVAGMMMLELIRLPLGNSGKLASAGQKLADKGSYAGAFVLGVIFALSFCPVTAATYFGSLMPMMVKQHSLIAMPLIFGAGSAAPVMAFAAVIAFSANAVAKHYNRLTAATRIAKLITGAIFILAGIFFTLQYTLELF